MQRSGGLFGVAFVVVAAGPAAARADRGAVLALD
jgi:hypothetical protein